MNLGTIYCTISGTPPIVSEDDFIEQLAEHRGQTKKFYEWYVNVAPAENKRVMMRVALLGMKASAKHEENVPPETAEAKDEEENSLASVETTKGDYGGSCEGSLDDRRKPGTKAVVDGQDRKGKGKALEEQQDEDDNGSYHREDATSEDDDDDESDGYSGDDEVSERESASPDEDNEVDEDEDDEDDSSKPMDEEEDGHHGDTDTEGSSDEDDSGPLADTFPSPEIMSGLLFKQENIDAANDLVLIAAYETDDKGRFRHFHCKPDQRDDGLIDPGAVDDPAKVIFNVVPDSDHSHGYLCTNPEERYEIEIPFFVGAFPITYTTYCILKSAAPRLTTQALYSVMHRNYRRGVAYPSSPLVRIRYGEIAQSLDHTPEYTTVIGGRSPRSTADERWIKLLSNKDRTTDEILWDAWRGKGRLRVFVRPDRFPISEAAAKEGLLQVQESSPNTPRQPRASKFGSLPLEVMVMISMALDVKSFIAFISINRSLRASLLPQVNTIAYTSMKHLEPFYFPAQPIESEDTSRRRRELDAWKSGWQKAGYSMDELKQKGPWFHYRVECSRSCSMRNRKRIWRIVEQVEKMAEEQGFI